MATVANNLIEHLIAQKFALGKPPSKVVIEPVIAPVVDEADNVTASVPVSAFGANKLRRMLEIADDITNAELSRKHISSTKVSLDDVTYTGGILMEIAATYGLGTIQVLECNRGTIKFQKKFSVSGNTKNSLLRDRNF